MVSADSGSSGPGSSPSREHCVVLGVGSQPGNGKPPIQGEGGSTYTPGRFMLQKPDKLWSDWPDADFTFNLTKSLISSKKVNMNLVL